MVKHCTTVLHALALIASGAMSASAADLCFNTDLVAESPSLRELRFRSQTRAKHWRSTKSVPEASKAPQPVRSVRIGPVQRLSTTTHMTPA